MMIYVMFEFKPFWYPFYNTINLFNVHGSTPAMPIDQMAVSSLTYRAVFGHCMISVGFDGHKIRSRYIAVIFPHDRHPLASRQGRGYLPWMQIWIKFYHCSCCAVCTIVSYITTIYRECIVIAGVHYRILYNRGISRVILAIQGSRYSWPQSYCLNISQRITLTTVGRWVRNE